MCRKWGWLKILEWRYQESFDAYKNEEKQPVFESTENFFYVTLPNLNYSENDQINDQINELDLIILKAIHNNPGIKVPEILRNLMNDNV